MTIVAVDGNHNLHRILHVSAFKNLTSRGQFTGGAFGGIQAIRNAIASFNARRCIVVWDGTRPQFRTQLVPGYKKNREPKNQEEAKEREEHNLRFASQRLLLDRMLSFLACHVISQEEAEGDDLLYAVVKLYPEERIVIVSEDMDLAQLVNDRVTLWRPGKEMPVTPQNFVAMTGVSQSRFLLRKALMGDSSDNVPGIAGVGEKRATAVLEEVASVPDSPQFLGLFKKHCSTHKSAPIRRIASQFSSVGSYLTIMDLSRYPWREEQLSTLKAQIDTPMSCEADKARKFFQQLEFGSLLDHYTSWVTPFLSLR